MATNKYLSYITDEHLMSSIAQLYDAYQKAKEKLTRKKFYKNKIDVFKLTFDKEFNHLSEEDLINFEMSRQIDKSVNNAMGTFHENILGCVTGFSKGSNSGFDIKAVDDSLFADIKNKHNTMNSSSAESLFQKLSRYADDYKNSTCYWVQLLSTDSFDEQWFSIINGKEYSHSRVRKISGDRFYALLTGQEDALFQLYQILPVAIKHFLRTVDEETIHSNSAANEIIEAKNKTDRTIMDQISFDNYCYYLGFDSL